VGMWGDKVGDDFLIGTDQLGIVAPLTPSHPPPSEGEVPHRGRGLIVLHPLGHSRESGNLRLRRLRKNRDPRFRGDDPAGWGVMDRTGSCPDQPSEQWVPAFAGITGGG
jgi:hypothetical protein